MRNPGPWLEKRAHLLLLLLLRMAFCVVTGVRPHAAHLREVLLLVADPLHELLDRDGVRAMYPFLNFDNARFPIRGGLLQRRAGTARAAGLGNFESKEHDGGKEPKIRADQSLRGRRIRAPLHRRSEFEVLRGLETRSRINPKAPGGGGAGPPQAPPY